VRAPSPRVVLSRPLVRRIYEKPLALPPRPFRERDDCWIPPATSDQVGGVHRNGGSGRGGYAHRDDARGGSAGGGYVRDGHAHDVYGGRAHDHVLGGNVHGRVDHMTGPYIVSGGWWNREVHREYHYARTEDGEILWVYYDRRRRRWFLTGKVE
jgi:hypothetical protein